MKALFTLLLLVGVSSSVFASKECAWTISKTNCQYAENHFDGNVWVSENCDNSCFKDGHQQVRPCLNSGFCLPPDQNPTDVLAIPEDKDPDDISAAVNYCGSWFQQTSNSYSCPNSEKGEIQWTRQDECVILTMDKNQYKTCSIGAPKDH